MRKVKLKKAITWIFIASIILVIVWFTCGVIEFFTDLHSSERLHIQGRDTVAFWDDDSSSSYYSLSRGPDYFVFFINDETGMMKTIYDVHFYANTNDFIYIITDDDKWHKIIKATGECIDDVIPDFGMISSEEQEVCFINLYNKQSATWVKSYN